MNRHPLRLAALTLALAAGLFATGCVVVPARGGYYGGAPGGAQAEGGYYSGGPVAVAPPPMHAEVITVAPGPAYIWIGGFWNWVGHRHAWVGGRWEQQRPGHHWVPHQWHRDGPGWRAAPGHWRRR